MVEIQFYLLDIGYKIIDGKPAIYLYGRTPEGQPICVIDGSFEPYFYVLPSHGADIAKLKGQLSKIRVRVDNDDEDEFFVTKIEEVKKNVFEQETTLLKVNANLPSGIPLIKQAADHLADVNSCYEYDINFVRKYLIDKSLAPLALLSADVETIGEKLKVPALKAASVKQFSDETMKHPKVIALDIETYNPQGSSLLPEEHPIVMLALYGENLKKVITWKRFSTEFENIEFVNSELELLERFKELVSEHSPDVIVGYYSDGFDFPYIAERAKKYKIKLDLGLDNSELRISGRRKKKAEITGIAHVDIYNFIRKVAGKSAGGLKTDILTLDAVSEEVLGEKKIEVNIEELAGAWDSTDAKMLSKFCTYNLNDARLAFMLCNSMLPNITEMVKIIGLPLADVNRMSFSQLVEWYAIRQAKRFNEIVPRRPGIGEQKSRMMTRIKGAFVFEPKPGFYKNIVVLDYRSLYPTIIASHNISQGTLNCSCCEGIAKAKVPAEGSTRQHWFCTRKKGFISSVIEDLISRRARIKQIMKTEGADTLLDARSYSLKVLANAFYGYLRFAPARWYSFECAESTTAWGRHYVKKVIEAAKKAGFETIYADTDSAFLLLGKKTIKDAERFVENQNKELPGLMELEFEGMYPSGIFVAAKAGETGAKKKYVLADSKGELKIRGFEAVRRNWSFVAKDLQRDIFNIVLKENNPKKALEHVKEVISLLRQGKMPIEKVMIYTQLQREIESYDSIGPHVAAAKLMRQKGISVRPGAIIKFVVCKGKGLIRDKVRLPEDIKPGEYDAEYYVNHQIIPSVEKIFAVLGYEKDTFASDTRQSRLGKFISG